MRRRRTRLPSRCWRRSPATLVCCARGGREPARFVEAVAALPSGHASSAAARDPCGKPVRSRRGHGGRAATSSGRPDDDGLDGRVRGFVRPQWPAVHAPAQRYIAAKAFASWTAYQGRGVATIVRGLEAALALVRVEAARQCRDDSRALDDDLLLEAFRSADFILNHLAVGRGLAERRGPRRRGRDDHRQISKTTLRPVRDRSCRTRAAPRTTWSGPASCLARQHVVQPPADVALLHVPPRRPPGEQVGVVGFDAAVHVDEAAADDALDERALLRKLADARAACAPSDARPSRCARRSDRRTARAAIPRPRTPPANASSASRKRILAGKSLPPFGT